MMIMMIFIIKNIFNLNKTYLGKYTVLRRKYKNTKTIDMTSTIFIQ